jgi:glutaredoxin
MPNKTVELYRLPFCPYGMRAKELLEETGFEINDHIFQSHDDADQFMSENGVDTTPQVFIDGDRIGGSDELEQYLREHSAAEA